MFTVCDRSDSKEVHLNIERRMKRFKSSLKRKREETLLSLFTGHVCNDGPGWAGPGTSWHISLINGRNFTQIITAFQRKINSPFISKIMFRFSKLLKVQSNQLTVKLLEVVNDP